MIRVVVITCLSILLAPALLWGQVPERKNRALVYKTTATWCYPCGTWGWDLANTLHDNLGDEMVYLALFNSSDGSYNNSAFYNAVAVTLAFNFRFSSWPSFGVNGRNLTDINNNQDAAIRKAVQDSVTAFNSRPVIANAASLLSIDESHNQIEVTTKATFFEATEGDYYLATYIVEEGAVNQQRGQSGLMEHRGVLRVALDSLDWGALIASDSVDSGYTISKDYTYMVTDDSWDVSKLVVCNIIWKKVGTKYEYVNGSKHGVEVTGIVSPVTDPLFDLKVFPNPADDLIHVRVLYQVQDDVHIRMLDLSGRTILDQRFKNPVNGMVEVQVEKLQQGLYILECSQGGRLRTEKVVLR